MDNLEEYNKVRDLHKSVLKSSLQAIIDLLNEKEEDVLHDYGKSSIEMAYEMINDLSLGGF